jgi:hypothetical protein
MMVYIALNWFDVDISHLHTIQGPITRASARQLDLQVRSNLVNCFSTYAWFHAYFID